MAPWDTWKLGLKHKRGQNNVVFPGAQGCRGWVEVGSHKGYVCGTYLQGSEGFRGE